MTKKKISDIKLLERIEEGIEILLLSTKDAEERFDKINSFLKGMDHVVGAIQEVLFSTQETIENVEYHILRLEESIGFDFRETITRTERIYNDMVKLTTDKRKKLAKSEFGMPKEKKYPMPDKSHAVNAKARATQMEKKGKLSPASKAKIDKKADKVIAKKRGRPKKEEGKMSMVSDKRIKDYGDKKKKLK